MIQILHTRKENIFCLEQLLNMAAEPSPPTP